MYVLIVEDEEKAATWLKKGFTEMSIRSDWVRSGLEAVKLVQKKSYDMIILDVMLPGIDGFEVVQRVRKSGMTVPILLVTAGDSVSDRVTGLQLGADDYLVKPFAFSELVARMQSLARRAEPLQQNELRVADLEMNIFARKVMRAGRCLDLTPKEFALLSLLMRRAGEVVARATIAERIWNLGFDANMKVVDVKIGNLRTKVDAPFATKLIHTVRGVGYVLEARDETPR